MGLPCSVRSFAPTPVRAALIGLGLLACQPQDGTPQTTVAPEPAQREESSADDTETGSETNAAASPPSETTERELTVDPAQSRIELFVSKATAGHEVRFDRFTATLGFARDIPTSLAITLQIASLKADQAALGTHLKGSDFFHAAKHPLAQFVSTSITPLAEPGDEVTHAITGDLTIKGTTKTIEFPARVHVSEAEVTGTATITIVAADFGVEYAGMAEEMVEEEVELEVKLVFPRG